MDLKDIQELIKFVAKSGATEVDLEIDNIKISIKSPAKKRRGDVDEPVTIIQQASPSTSVAAPTPVAVTTDKPTPVSEKTSTEDDNSNYITIKASMIGTFYRSTSPETPPFVNIGDSIGEGDTLCIIEAMKIFNEIESDISGKVESIVVKDSTPVEYDQDLLVISPK